MKPRAKSILAAALAVILAALLATGCCNCKKGLQKAYGKPLTGHEWVFTQFEGKSFGADTSKYSVTFDDDGTLVYRSAGRSFAGSFTYTGEGKFEGRIQIVIPGAAESAAPSAQATISILPVTAGAPPRSGDTGSTGERIAATLAQADYYRLDMYMLLLYRGREMVAMLETDRWK